MLQVIEAPLISIEVTPDIAARIRFMAESGVFNMVDGSATLHFQKGKLTKIMRQLYTYVDSDVDMKER